ncbi:MAG: type I methionyl aminopeptidase, partial [Clostridia bacterium]|nr:type I methionyl aminopeptidase [Clostridia bacterium]
MIHVKSEKEIELMREPCRIVRDTLKFVETKICAGMTTKELDVLIERFIRSEGAYPSCLGYGGFPASACISVNETVVHGIPDEYVLKNGDIVTVDLCAYKNGYHGDACRTFCIGDVKPEIRQLVKVTEECFFKAIEGLKAGTPLYDIGYKVQQHAESHGYGVIRSYTGHGIGKEMHEDPSVPNYGKKGTGIRL